jgi:DNA-binding CsgD family transcriptional regulator
MGRRNRRWDPPLGGPCPNLGPSMSESVSDDEKAGKPLAPLVELRPCGPPLEITEAGPLPLPPLPPPFNREAALAGLQTAFAQLTNDELEVARMRMLGIPYVEISEELGMLDDEVETLWKQARRKLGSVLFGRTSDTTLHVTNPVYLDPEAGTRPSQESEGAPPA